MTCGTEKTVLQCHLMQYCNFRFRLKYHPEEYNKRQEESKAAVQKRCEVFSRLLELNRVASVSLEVTRTDDIVSLLDAGIAVAVIIVLWHPVLGHFKLHM